MSGTSPEAILYDSNGNLLAVQNGSAIPASTPGLLVMGSDGTNSRYITVDSSGRPVMVGAGTAGTPSGGVVSIQGVSGGQAVPISGSVSITGTAAVTQSTSPWVDNITQFGGNNVVTGTGASGVGIPRVTIANDSNILATQSGTWTVQQGTPPWTVSQSTASNLNATVVGLGTAGTPSGGILSVQVPDTTNSGTLNALNAAATITLAGNQGAGMQLSAGTLVGTIVPEVSYDAGTTWVASFFDDPTTGNKVSSIVFGANNTATARTIVIPAGASSARVRVSVFTSGTANCNLRASSIVEPPVLFSGAAASTSPPTILQVGGNDGSNLRAMLTDASGHPIIVGPGTAGTPSGGVVSIQGVSGGQTVPVSGTVAVTQSTSPWVDNITQFGGVNISTGTGASGTGIPRVTVANDSNILATQSGTWTVQPGNTANTTPWLATINQGGNSAAVKAASTAAAATDPALVVAISPNNSVNAFPSDVTTSGALGALNAAVTITHPGLESVGFQLAAGTLAATLVAEVSFDGGTTWNATYFKRSSDDAKFATIGLINPNSAQAYSIVGAGGAGQTRVRVSAYTSGTANGTIRASNIIDVQPLYASTIGAVAPPSAVQIGGANAGTTVAAVMKGSSTAAATADASLVVGLSPNSPLPTGTNNIGSVNYVQSAETTAAWTSSTTNNTVLALTVTGYGTVTVTLNQGSTITGGAVTFEGSDTVAGTNWYPISMVSTAGATVPTSTYTLVASTNVAFQTNVAGFIQFRVRLSPAISGTGTVNVGITANASATEWQQATYITDGTHGPVTVKVSSTAAVASDQPLVVTIHPSSASLPVTNIPSSASPTIVYGDVTLNTITTATVERTTYTEQTTNFTGSVVSSSASDASAGTGARQVKITYVDSTGATAGTETVTLNGTTAVNLVTTTKCFIEKMEVTSVGSTGNNVGTISLFTGAAGAGTLVGTIGATDNKTFWAHHYVVTGKTFNLTSFIAGSTQAVANNGSSWVLRSKPIGVATAVEVQINDTITLYGQSSQVTRNYTTAIPVATGPTRIKAYVTTLASASATYRGAFDFYES